MRAAKVILDLTIIIHPLLHSNEKLKVLYLLKDFVKVNTEC